MSRFDPTCLLLLLCFVGDIVTEKNHEMSEQREKNNGLEATRQDLDFLVRPNMTHWEQLLLPAPTVVSLLGQMVVLSSKIDVSLEGARPRHGWRFVQNPQSLRACLIQIGHQAWDAFRIAQGNMDEIQLTMSIVPMHLQSAIKIIKTMPPSMIGKLLPKTLDRISQSAIISENLIITTETAFINVMRLTAEIELSVATTQGIVDQNLTSIYAQISYTDKLLEKMNDTTEMVKKQYDIISSEKARQANETAVKNVKNENETLMDALFDRLSKLNREMAQIEADLAALDITKINLQDIRTLLSKVIPILGKIREQWDSLIEFFQVVAMRTTIINRDIIRQFLRNTTELTENMDASARDAILSHVLNLAVDVNSASFFLHTIAKTYVDVSHQYILQKLAGLSQLLSAESDEERTRLRGEILANAASAREGIHVLIQGLRDTYKKKLEEQRQQLKQYEQSFTSVIGTSDGGEDTAAIEKGRIIAETVGVVLPDSANRIL